MKHWLKRRGIPLAILLVVVIVAAVMFMRWMNGDSTGTVKVGVPTAASDVPVVQAPVDVHTAYFSTQLPGSFVIKRNVDTPDGPQFFLQLVANSSGEVNQQFAATVGPMPAAGMSDIGDYHMRTLRTDTYASFSPANLPAGAVAFRSVSGTSEATLFWPHGGRYLELSFTGGNGVTEAQLLETYQLVMSAWQW